MNVTGDVTSERHLPSGLRPLVALASRQGGFFATRQAEGAGVSRRMLSYYRTRGIRDSYGIYRMHWLPHHRFGDVIAACLWAGPASAASMETALVVHGLSDAMPSKIHITVPHRFTGRRDGVVVHAAPLATRDRLTVDDVPVTSVARTLADVAKANQPLAAQATHEAMSRGLISHRRLRMATNELT